MDIQQFQDTLISLTPTLGVALPIIQNRLNQYLEKPRTVLGFVLDKTTQRIILNYFLSFLVALFAIIVTADFHITSIATTGAEVFALSQLAYYSFFRKTN